MCTEHVPNLDWPRDLYRGAIDPRIIGPRVENGFLEHADLDARIEKLSHGGKPVAILRFTYRGRD